MSTQLSLENIALWWPSFHGFLSHTAWERELRKPIIVYSKSWARNSSLMLEATAYFSPMPHIILNFIEQNEKILVEIGICYFSILKY